MDGAARLPFLEMERKEKEEKKRQRLGIMFPLDTPVEFLQNNPKSSKSMSYTRYENYKHAKNMGEYFQLGGTRGDIKYDVAKGYMRIAVNASGDETFGPDNV